MDNMTRTYTPEFWEDSLPLCAWEDIQAIAVSYVSSWRRHHLRIGDCGALCSGALPSELV